MDEGKPHRIVRLQLDKDEAPMMIPRVNSATSPATKNPASSDTSSPQTPTLARDCSGPSSQASPENNLTKALSPPEYHSDHAGANETSAYPVSGYHQADGLMDRNTPSYETESSKVIDQSVVSNLPANNDNEILRNLKAVLPTKQNDMTSQAAVTPHGNGDTTMAGGKDASDEDLDIMDGTDDPGEELLFLRQELAPLETKKRTRFWKATDEDRFQEITRRIKELETIKSKANMAPDEDECRARAAAQSLMPLTLDAFVPPSKDSDERSKKTKTVHSSKRKVADGSVPCTDPSPAQKKQRVAKAAVKSTTSKTNSVVPIPNLLKLSGNGENKFSKETLKDLTLLSKAPAHVKSHLQHIQTCALSRPGVDKDTITAHVRLLTSMTKILHKKVQPWQSKVKDNDKTLDDYRWSVAGMSHALYHHQLVAAAIMTGMERNTDESRNGSGLLFDHMGYGKTIEALALIMSNPPIPPSAGTSGRNGERLTVVVCPTNVGRQWVAEVENHCHGLNVALWCESLEVTATTLFRFDVLVVSYERLRELYKKGVRDPRRESALFRAKLHRLILDEIHEIKSPKAESVTFRACIALNAQHYWGLSGTPTPNGIEELYPYLLFIRHPRIKTMAEFKANFVGGKGRHALSRKTRNSNLTEQLGPYVMLRTPKHRLLGEALVNLPEAHEIYKNVYLGKEERTIYDRVESDMRDYMIKKTGKTGRSKRASKKIGKKNDDLTWANLQESVLRFRQCVASPLLLENLVKDGIWTRDNVQAMRAQALSEGCSETPFIDMIERWIEEPRDAASQEIAHVARGVRKYQCPGCGKLADSPRQASCDHIWCEKCLVDYIDSRKQQAAPDHQKPACPLCHKILGEEMRSPLPGLDNANGSKRAKSMSRQPGDDYNRFQPKPVLRSRVKSPPKPTLFEHLDGNPSAPIPLSAKMRAIVDQVLEWQKEAASDKIIIFTQFIDVNRLIGRALQKENIEFLYFVGGMGEAKRADARTSFAQIPEVKVMLVSLKCGGQALNLTQANRVIIADPWWNRCAEQQAFARVHRLGQEKETYAVRFLAEGTVDSRMHELQQKKLDETQGAIEEFQADKSLGPRTLRMILGKDWYDEEVDDDEVSDYEGEGVDGSEELPAAADHLRV